MKGGGIKVSGETFKNDEYQQLSEVISKFRKIINDGLSDQEIEMFMPDNIYSFTDAQMNRMFNV